MFGFLKISKKTIKYFIEKNKTKKLLSRTNELELLLKSFNKNVIFTKTDLSGKITQASNLFCDISGYTQDELIGQPHSMIKHEDTPDDLFLEIWKNISAESCWQGEIKNKRKDGTHYWLLTKIEPEYNLEGILIGYNAIRQNITSKKELQRLSIELEEEVVSRTAELKKVIYTDYLTDLKNRNALIYDINKTKKPSLLLIDIDNFSQLNDLYGHDFGDKVIKAFSRVLEDYIKDKEKCKLFRLNGDEFVMLFPEMDSSSVIDSATRMIQKISSNVTTIDSQEILLNITAGISFEEKENLLSSASMALTVARRKDIDILVYDKSFSLNKEYANNLIWVKKIKEAIKDDRITVYFQPIINNSDGTITRYETLIRLIESDGTVVTPYHFLDIAKKTKLYRELTKIVIKKSFEAFKDNEFEFSVNISVDDIIDEEINLYIHEMLLEYDISNRVIFEIVESESIEKFDVIGKFITSTKALGCRIAIDDFGTGYSSFEYLMKLQADYIKIDGSIIKEIIHDKNSEIITSVIIDFAKKMNIKTIGEYVETEEIHIKIKALGIDKSQGYYFSEPKATI